MTLIQMWEEAKKDNKLPKEFERWEDLRTWAINNRYKAEYGYKGEFTPEGCLKAMPCVVGVDLSSEPDKTTYKVDFKELMRMKLDELRELASKLGIKISDNATKREISNLIVERGQL